MPVKRNCKFKFAVGIPVLISMILLNFAPNVHAKDLIVGMLLAGAHNDNSYNQFHLDAARKAAENLKNIRIIYIDQANSIVRPANVTIPAMVDDLVQKGATVIIANAYEMELGIAAAAPHYPQVTFIQIDGGEALTHTPRPNIVNVTLMFEYAQMLTGFAAGMSSATGKIGYLGGSPNSDSYRQISAAYLGAKYAWETVRGMPAKDFRFRLKWMGNWFDNLSSHEDTRASTLKLFDSGSDVIIGGNYNTDIFKAAEEAYDANKKILITTTANPYMPQNNYAFLIGLGFYDWLPVYEDLFSKAKQETLSSNWLRFAPDLAHLNKFGYSNIGFLPYDGLDLPGKEELDRFVEALAGGKLNLFKGPLNYKDGNIFVEDGQIPSATALRNMSQLVEGIEEMPYTQDTANPLRPSPNP